MVITVVLITMKPMIIIIITIIHIHPINSDIKNSVKLHRYLFAFASIIDYYFLIISFLIYYYIFLSAQIFLREIQNKKIALKVYIPCVKIFLLLYVCLLLLLSLFMFFLVYSSSSAESNLDNFSISVCKTSLPSGSTCKIAMASLRRSIFSSKMS